MDPFDNQRLREKELMLCRMQRITDKEGRWKECRRSFRAIAPLYTHRYNGRHSWTRDEGEAPKWPNGSRLEAESTGTTSMR